MRPTEEFWLLAGVALFFFAILAGVALVFAASAP